ncbi:hypothetical protein N7520_002131 [Penicillium odoratum]|uniref:uncharacterized protein n=1 Tax=Penicillium odoratum TaxID=1167516 RepID=UPI00254912B9|nr:uncharacterized protein N7520_002131 [Penicillium odoratum]KAJ5771602.1 hypothetical protein N7520_002131 [Penicillium odoratum]
MQGTVFIHRGSYESITENASPGLRFLNRFLPAVESVNPTQDPIGSFFKSNAFIIIGSNPSRPAQPATHYESQSRYLSYFHHYLHVAWDMDLTLNSFNLNTESHDPHNSHMKRTVMFEATSETIFKDDPDQFSIKTCEFNILDLEGTAENLQIVEMRMFLDAKPIQARAASLTRASAFGESQREADAE